MIAILFLHLLFAGISNSGVIPCQEPNNCSVHVFTVRLSQKPEGRDDTNNNITDAATIKVQQRKKFGNNYFEIKSGADLSEQMTKEIIDSIPLNADQRLKDKITRNEFVLKPVDPSEEQIMPIAPIPPEIPQTPPPSQYQPPPASYGPALAGAIPWLLVGLLVCIGIVFGVLITALCLVFIDLKKQPKFDRSNAVTYKKSIDTESLVRSDRIVRIPRRALSSNLSQASTSRGIIPSRTPRRNRSGEASRQISL